MELRRMSSASCDAVRLHKDALACFEVLQTSTIDIQRMPFELTGTAVGMTMESIDAEHCFHVAGPSPYECTFLQHFGEATANIVTNKHLPTSHVDEAVDESKWILSTL